MELSTLSLLFKQTHATKCYVMNNKIQTLTVTLTDNNKEAGLHGCIFNMPRDTVTMLQTSLNPINNNAAYLANVNASSNSVPCALNLGGINFINMFCDVCQGYKAAHVSLPGCVNS